MENLKDIVVIYHAECSDGFGAAYAAWKKFGDSASYLPRKTQDPVPEGLTGKEIYIVDYSYKKPYLDKLMAENKSVVVIDHHESAESAVRSFSQNVFDKEHSGAVLSWMYFHPDTPVPKLLLHVEDHDLWRFRMEHHREFGAALGEYSRDFETWDQLNDNFENKELFDSFLRHGAVIAGFEDKLIEKILTFREKVLFEGFPVYAVNAERIYRSILGHKLAVINKEEGREPFGIVYYRYDGMVHCSLRGNDGFDVRTLAEKHGGGGHKTAASIRVPDWNSLPFKYL